MARINSGRTLAAAQESVHAYRIEGTEEEWEPRLLKLSEEDVEKLNRENERSSRFFF